MRIRYERVCDDIKCIRTTLERFEGGSDILSPLDFYSRDFETERLAHCLNVAHLQHRFGIVNIGHDCQAAETGENLAQ